MKRWISFHLISATDKTKIWEVASKDGEVVLGTVRWHGAWRRYSFFPERYTVFEKTCLRDIADFCDQQTKKHFEARKRAKEAA